MPKLGHHIIFIFHNISCQDVAFLFKARCSLNYSYAFIITYVRSKSLCLIIEVEKFDVLIRPVVTAYMVIF